MAIFTNTSGAKLVLNDEFGLPVSFEPGETKTGMSNYLERYTSAYQTGLDILLSRVGNLDPDVNDGGIPVAAIEEENLAVRPSQPNNTTSGVYWGVPGKSNTAIPAGYIDSLNTSERLRRIAFDTSADIRRRQIDTRYLDVKSSEEIAFRGTHADAAVDISGGTAAVDLDTVSTVVKVNGLRATAADVANPVYGSLLTEGSYYTAFGTMTCVDNGTGTELVGFALQGTSTDTFTTLSTIAWTGLSIALSDADTITVTITNGAASDTVAMTAVFTQDISTATRANTFYDSDDELRGWYEVEANTTTGAVAGVLLMTDGGILHVLDGVAIDFVSWS